MSLKHVDKTTFDAMVLAKEAIEFTHLALPHGSANQLNNHRDIKLSLDIKQLRLTKVRNVTMKIHQELKARGVELTPEHFFAVHAGIANFYNVGNCAEHLSTAFLYLCKNGFTGIEITGYKHTEARTPALIQSDGSTDSEEDGHVFALIHWDGCTDPVVCDGWPSKPQVCLWSQFFLNPEGIEDYSSLKRIVSFKITKDNKGKDFLKEAIGIIKSNNINKKVLDSNEFSFGDSRDRKIHDISSTLNENSQPHVDFVYEDRKLSEVNVDTTKWVSELNSIMDEIESLFLTL